MKNFLNKYLFFVSEKYRVWVLVGCFVAVVGGIGRAVEDMSKKSTEVKKENTNIENTDITKEEVKDKPKDEPKTNTCKMEVKELVRNGKNYYFSCKGFDSKNVYCWNVLRSYKNKGSYENKFTLHFLDNLDNFNLPAEGLYGGDEIRKKVIAQYVSAMPDNNFIVDPFGFGVYVEN